LGIVVPDVQRDLGLSDELMGWVPACLSIVLGIMIPISGILGDRYSRKWIITWTLIIGSAATALAGASVGFFTLVLFYSVTSATCEAMYAPSGTRCSPRSTKRRARWRCRSTSRRSTSV
jgi:MFS family permease